MNRLRISTLGDRALSAEIRAEMARQGLNQGALADAIGFKRTSLSNRLNGKTAWTYTDLRSVALALGLRASDLVARAEAAIATGSKAVA